MNSTFITGWLTVPGYDGTFTGAVEYFHDRSQDPGGYSVELGFYDGSTGLQQTFSTSLNQVYFVTFWLATDPFNGSSPGRLRVSAGGTSMDCTATLPTGSAAAMGRQQPILGAAGSLPPVLRLAGGGHWLLPAGGTRSTADRA